MVDIEHGTWKSKDGKLVKYTKENYRLNSQDDFNEYHLQITRWPKTTSIEIVVMSGDEGDDYENRWSDSTVYRYVKLPHAEFEAKRDELIQKVVELANQQFGYITF
ncbi:hypothetical protein [Microcoleus sp. OTE_8_concoct_300]|uniref:hypothetical protein n=1 Tax=Microcoleus sp. OTE_8_concoct_300 TaxID=2964710 RepID=UPI00403F3646